MPVRVIDHHVAEWLTSGSCLASIDKAPGLIRYCKTKDDDVGREVSVRVVRLTSSFSDL